MLPALYAHRLGRAYGPDSSLAALHRAIQQPLDGLETDCCLTADGELVLLHDPLLDLGTTVSGWAHQRTAAEIRAGWLRNRDGTPSDERPLLLDELLNLAPPGATLQLEVKAHAEPSPRTPHRASRLRATSRPPSSGADRDHQLLVRRMRTRRRARLPGTAGDHRRLPHTRTRRLGTTRRPARRMRRALPPLPRAGCKPPSLRAQRHDRHDQPRRDPYTAPAAWPRRHHKRLPTRAAPRPQPLTPNAATRRLSRPHTLTPSRSC